MTWQAAVFAGLAVVVVGGFWWYERSRPSARLVALVAALAALAVAGRLVFAPVPNLVATTDIALLTGYALGAGPGFAVGALAAPISNIWLGQGPWTAWQMAGWGLVGLGGAWLATVTRRRLGRLGLATACGVAGFAYGALLDLSVMVTYGGEQSLDRYLALSARGLPFNVVHAVGNFAIALAAGPALVRMISRFRTRLEFTWRPAGALPAVLLALAVAASAASPPDPAGARASAAGWLAGTQNSDGGFAAVEGQPSSPAMTGWVALGLEAAGSNPLDVRSGGPNAVAYLRAEADRVRSVGDLERTILALAGAGVDARRFGGTDLVERLRKRRDADGSVDGQVNLTAFYVLAMRSAGVDPGSLARPVRWLRHAQNGDGGWGIQRQAPSEADSTGAVLQALVAAGASGGFTADGARWLRTAQRSNGGWALGGSGVVNSQSAAWAIQGLVAAGEGARQVDRGLAYLARLRAPDGHYRYSASSDQTPVWVTAQVLMAVERQPFPVPAVGRSSADRGGGDEAQNPGGDGGDAASGSSGSGGGATPGAPGPDAGGTPNGGDTGSDPAQSGDRGSPAAEPAGGGASPQADSATPGPTASAEPAPPAEPGTPAVSVSYPEAEGDGSTTPYLLGGVAVLAAVVAGGLWWRRRTGR